LSRAISLVVHNWPLKVAAVALATLLYAGLVLTQNTRVWPGRVAIVPENVPPDAVLVAVTPSEVTEIRYRAPADVQPTSGTFSAFVDLAGVDVSSGSAIVNVVVEASDQRIDIVDVQPSSVRVELDPLTTKTVPIEVDQGQVPDGLEVGEPDLAVDQAVVSGRQSLVDRVDHAIARVTIQPSGIDVDEDVPLVAVDALGDVVSPVDIEPEAVGVRIRVGSAAETKSLPVNPILVGTPADGFQVGPVTVTPAAVTVEGDADALAALTKVDTVPVNLGGVTSDVAATVELALPTDVQPLGATSVQVRVSIVRLTGTRTFSAGILLAGARDDRTYTLSTDRVAVVIGGPVADLDRLDPATFTATVDVAALPPGAATDVPVRVGNLPAGLSVVSISPDSITVVVGVPASPSPSAEGGPSPSP
jgi:YbbR domain-containing protein